MKNKIALALIVAVVAGCSHSSTKNSRKPAADESIAQTGMVDIYITDKDHTLITKQNTTSVCMSCGPQSKDSLCYETNAIRKEGVRYDFGNTAYQSFNYDLKDVYSQTSVETVLKRVNKAKSGCVDHFSKRAQCPAFWKFVEKYCGKGYMETNARYSSGDDSGPKQIVLDINYNHDLSACFYSDLPPTGVRLYVGLKSKLNDVNKWIRYESPIHKKSPTWADIQACAAANGDEMDVSLDKDGAIIYPASFDEPFFPEAVREI